MQDTLDRGLVSAPRPLLFVATAFAGAVLAAGVGDLLPEDSMLRLGLGVVAAVLIVVAALLYLLSPLFSAAERARARHAYGSHRDVLANGVTAVAVGQLVFLPILLAGLAAALNGQDGPAGVWRGILELLQKQQPMVLFLALVGLDLAFILVVYVRLVRTGAVTGRGLGLTAERFWPNVGFGLVGWIMILLASAVLGLAFLPSGARQQQAELKVIGEATPAVFYLFFVAGSLLAPFTEELFFRGYVFRAYAAGKGLRQAYLLSSAVFALPHLNPTAGPLANLALFAPLMAIGLILAYLMHRSGSLVAPVVAHGLNNALALAAVYVVARLPV